MCVIFHNVPFVVYFLVFRNNSWHQTLWKALDEPYGSKWNFQTQIQAVPWGCPEKSYYTCASQLLVGWSTAHHVDSQGVKNHSCWRDVKSYHASKQDLPCRLRDLGFLSSALNLCFSATSCATAKLQIGAVEGVGKENFSRGSKRKYLRIREILLHGFWQPICMFP